MARVKRHMRGNRVIGWNPDAPFFAGHHGGKRNGDSWNRGGQTLYRRFPMWTGGGGQGSIPPPGYKAHFRAVVARWVNAAGSSAQHLRGEARTHPQRARRRFSYIRRRRQLNRPGGGGRSFHYLPTHPGAIHQEGACGESNPLTNSERHRYGHDPLCCGPSVRNVEGELWLLYSVSIHPAVRAVFDTRTSSNTPFQYSHPEFPLLHPGVYPVPRKY